MEYRHLHAHLDAIRERLQQMATAVEDQLGRATRAVVERDGQLGEAVLEQDRIVDRLEMEIDEACHSVLARNQPTAIDMRFLVAVMKITADLERMGDSAVNMAQAARQLAAQPSLEHGIDMAAMADRVQVMVRGAFAAFLQRDASAARHICAADDAVDTAYKSAFADLVSLMRRDPETVTRAVHLLLICRNLERIADHATNIAEDVIYYVEGRDVRHSTGEAAEPL